MAIEKSLSQAPLGLGDLDPQEMGNEPALEITIEDPESVELGIDGQPILKIEKGEEGEDDFDANLAEELSEQVLTMLASDLVSDYDADLASRKDWVDRKSTRLNSSHIPLSRMPSSA